ncbi:MAG: class B sortase, partial [Lachnospiraceae bacterium]
NKDNDIDFIDIDDELKERPARKKSSAGSSHSSKSGSKSARRRRRRRRLMIRRAVFLTALLVFIFSSVMLIKSCVSYMTADKIYSNIEDQVFTAVDPVQQGGSTTGEGASAGNSSDTVNPGEKKVTLMTNYNHQALVNLNSDAVGYIQIPAIDILLPVVQGSDNSHYLTHTLTGESSKSGTLFINCFNTEGIESRNTVIYGHNMKNGSMFGNLKKFMNKDFFNEGENRFIYFYTGNVIYKYEIYSVHTTPAISEPGGTYTTDFVSSEDFVTYLNSMAKLSYHSSNAELSADSKTITLSTCTNDDSVRFVVQAVRVETIYQ